MTDPSQRFALVVIGIALVACSGDGATDGDPPGGGMEDPGEGTPILEREPRLTYDCVVSQSLAKLGINPWYGGNLARTDAGRFLVRGEGELASSMVVSTLDATGALGPSTLLESLENGYFFEPAVAASDDGFAAIWWAAEQPIYPDREEKGHWSLATLDEEGAILAGPLSPVGFATASTGVAIAVREDGYALLWTETDEGGLAAALRFGLVDASGAFEDEPKTLATDGQAAWLSAFGDGFIAVASGSLFFLDADGTPRGDPVPFTGDRILIRGEELVVSSGFLSGDHLERYGTAISISRLDGSGAPVAPPVLLQSPVLDVQNVNAELVAYGDDIGVVWSQGSVIYVCGGCTPDNHLRFVVLDGDDLTPLSEVVELENLEPRGGFVEPRSSRDGDEFTFLSALEYHTSAEAAWGRVTCSLLDGETPSSR